MEPLPVSCIILPMETNVERKHRNQEMNRLLGRRLTSMRIANKVRQEEVADAMGFMRPLVSKIESGKRALDAVEIPAYAHAIGVAPEDVFDAILEIREGLDSIAED
jgi:transcriptional regulator with XRE-family HTH domain